jgi:phosphohistidine phosphatase
MKYLTLIRHAKSSHDDPWLTDFERVLNPRGLHDAPAIGRYLAKTHHFAPDAIVASPAHRAAETIRAIAHEIAFPEANIQWEPRIYEAPRSTLAAVVQRLAPTADHVCMIGHNPGFSELTAWLCGAAPAEGFKTCAVAMLHLDIAHWTDARPGCGTLETFFYPASIA